MAQVLTKDSGTGTAITGILPTADEFAHENAKKANRIADKQARKAEAHFEKTRQKSRLLTEGERQAGAIAGLKVAAKRKSRSGDQKSGEKINTAAELAEKHSEEWKKLTKALHEKRPTPLQDAIRAAAKGVRKAIPAAFKTEADALVFARTLPLLDAHVEAHRLADYYGRMSRDRDRASRELWAAVESVSGLSTGSANSDAAIRTIVDIGLDR